MGADVLPYEVVCASDDESWLEKRLTGIGGSEIAAVLGESPWSSAHELYREKVGEVEPRNLDDLEFIQWGKRLEGPILRAYEERTGRPTRKRSELLRSKAHPWALSTLDGETSDGETAFFWPLEAKTTNEYLGFKWVDGAPDYYLAQAHQQMLVTGAPRCTVACLIGGQRLVWQDVERDETWIRRIVYHGERFWQRVLDRDPPPLDGTEATARALLRAHPKDDGSTLVLAEELEADVEELLRLKAQGKALDEQKRAVEARLKDALGAAQRGVFADSELAISWKTQERRGYVVEPSTSRVFRIHQPKG